MDGACLMLKLATDTTEAPQLSVVIPTLRRYDCLGRVLDALEHQTVGTDVFEVIVVADAAEPRPDLVDDAMAGRRFPARRLQAERVGASAARNVGWRAASADLVLFLDDDIQPEERLIREHLRWHGRYPADIVGVIGRVRWARNLRVTPFMHWLDHGVQFDFSSIRGIDAGWGRFYTANASVKRGLLDGVGGFDEERLPYLYEDLDLALRMSAHGFRVLYNRAAVGFHLQPASIERWRQRLPVLARAEHAFCTKYPDVPAYFHERFSAAHGRPPAHGRLARLVRVIPRRTPVIGRAVWRSADAYFGQALAETFLAAWMQAESERGQDSTPSA